MKRFALVLLAGLSLYACKDDLKEEQQLETKTQKEDYCNLEALYSTHHTISQSKAERMALNFVNQPIGKGDKSLKNVKINTVDGTCVLKVSNSLKSSKFGADTLAYIVNLSDNQGYVYVCADDRLTSPVIAVFDGGNFATDSLKNNEEIRSTFNKIERYINNQVIDFENKKHDRLLKVEAAIKRGDLDTTSKLQLKNASLIGIIHQIENVEKVGPFLQTRTGQDGEYNYLLPECNNPSHVKNGSPCRRHVKTGCTLTAVAQIMTYYRYGAEGVPNFDWNSMVYNFYFEGTPEGMNSKQSQTREMHRANFMKYFYEKSKPGILYTGCNATAIDFEKGIRPWLQRNYHISERRTYIWDNIKDWFKYFNTPIYVMGSDPSEYNRYVPYSGHHAWVMDGYWTVKEHELICFTDNSVKKRTRTRDYVHHNWGWNGYNNGFILEGVYTTDGAYDFMMDKGCEYGGDDMNYNGQITYYVIWSNQYANMFYKNEGWYPF